MKVIGSSFNVVTAVGFHEFLLTSRWFVPSCGAKRSHLHGNAPDDQEKMDVPEAPSINGRKSKTHNFRSEELVFCVYQINVEKRC